DAHEARFLLQLSDGGAAAVAHARAQSADQLIDHGGHGAAIGHAALDTLGNKLGEAVAIALAIIHAGARRRGFIFSVLHVTLTRPDRHGGQRPHAAILLEGAALIKDGLAGTFFG